ncbi:MAG: hypothetical protein JO048_12595 [Methylobacteriaceae bacterium]|nr:hypothetical protein [Methylobacteriaceae bacterium]
MAEYQKLKVVDVSVEGAEVVRSWPAEERTFLQMRPDPDIAARIDSEPASNFPAVRAHIGTVLTTRFKTEFASQVSPILSGTRPVRAIVRLKLFDVPSTARRIFVDNDAKMRATIDLVDAKTGALVASYEGPYRSRRLIGGVMTGLALALDHSDTGQALITQYMSEYRAWLVGDRAV